MLSNTILYGKKDEYNPIYKIFDTISQKNEYCEAEFLDAVGKILKTAQKYNFSGNCFKTYIAWLLITDENPYSLECEMKKGVNSSLKSFALFDMTIIRSIFFADADVSDSLPENAKMLFSMLKNFKSEEKKPTNLTAIGILAIRLADKLLNTDSAEKFLDVLTEFYSHFGTGMFGLNKAFRICEHTDGGFSLIPASAVEDVTFSDLWGYEDQKNMLIKNTQDFIAGIPSNNVLLYGDSGTGKSTCIKALLNEYYKDGLRIIEIYKHQFKFLSPLLNLLKNRNYSFIIYMDDLSFEDFEIEYKYLKAVIEGGMETNPDNVLIYATSNRRHLIKETWKDRDDYDNDLHHSDTMQEKLSLSDRFGLAINFTKPVQKEYFEIVKHLAKKHNIGLSEDELISVARAWGVGHGGYTGRAAKQLIINLMGHN